MWFPKEAERFLQRDRSYTKAKPKAGMGEATEVPSLFILLDLCTVRKDLAPVV